MPTQQEAEGIANATAVATGSDTVSPAALRRPPRPAASVAIDAEERRRLGREYLARRNQELMDVRKGKASDKSISIPIMDASTPEMAPKSSISTRRSSRGHFDGLVNRNGTLRTDTADSPVTDGRIDRPAHLPAPVVSENTAAADSFRTFDAGAAFRNPFADEYAVPIDRSETPRPVAAASSHDNATDLSYDEQLARALSLSLADQEHETLRRMSNAAEEDAEIARAILASLDNGNGPSSAGSKAEDTTNRGPLVDFSDESRLQQAPTTPPSWSWAQREEEELYYLTPHATGVTPKQSASTPPYPTYAIPASTVNPPPMGYRPAGRAPIINTTPPQARGLDSLLYTSLPAVPTHEPYTARAAEVPVENVPAHSEANLSPSLPSVDALSPGFQSDPESDDYVSLGGSMARSEPSVVDVTDLDDSSDEDGTHTPRSWSEVGSDVGDISERSDSETDGMVRI